MAILYLENNLITGAFTRDRVAILNILCSQAAISLENARLYQESQQLYQQSQDYAQKLEHSISTISNKCSCNWYRMRRCLLWEI
jgi:GAF domain-containing protein